MPANGAAVADVRLPARATDVVVGLGRASDAIIGPASAADAVVSLSQDEHAGALDPDCARLVLVLDLPLALAAEA